jgi:PhnB protein
MAITPYLAFPGTARAAFTFYHEVFGGDLNIMGMSDMPPGTEVPPGTEQSVMHAEVVFEGGHLMGADGPPDVAQTGMCSMYMLDDEPEALRAFAALAEGGTTIMPIEPTFYAAQFGMCIDRFGTPWMIYCNFPAET